MPKLVHKKGYTLIELLVVMVIIGMILVFGVTSYQGFNERQKIKLARQQVLNDLRYARSMATNGKKPSGCTRLEGYSINVPAGGSNVYNISAECIDENGVYENCVDPECVKQVVLTGGSMVQIIPPGAPIAKIVFYTLGRGTDVDHPSNEISVFITAPAISADIEYKIIVNTAGSISPQ